MADREKLSERIETVLTENGFLHIILEDGLGAYESWKVGIDTLRNIFRTRYAAQSSAFTMTIPADSLLTSIDLVWVSSAPFIKVGKTLGANDIISGRTLSVSKDSLNILRENKNITTLYFTITGGVSDIIVKYEKNFNS